MPRERSTEAERGRMPCATLPAKILEVPSNSLSRSAVGASLAVISLVEREMFA